MTSYFSTTVNGVHKQVKSAFVTLNSIYEKCYEGNLFAWIKDFEFIDNNDGTATLTMWKGTHNGVNSTKLIIPDSDKIVLKEYFPFSVYNNVTKIVIPNNIKLTTSDFSNAFINLVMLKEAEANHPNIANMYQTYYNCYRLTGSPVCGNKVINMANAYYNCNNLTGNPICGNNVTNMSYAYYQCYNLTGSPVCGNNVTNMSAAYVGCYNLTGSPVCGDNVTNMAYAYTNCYNLTGNPVCGNNVTNMYYAYYNCKKLNSYSTMYIYNNNVTNVRNCFGAKNNLNYIAIHAYPNTTTWNTLLINNTSSIVGANITWSTEPSGYSNRDYGIYI